MTSHMIERSLQRPIRMRYPRPAQHVTRSSTLISSENLPTAFAKTPSNDGRRPIKRAVPPNIENRDDVQQSLGLLKGSGTEFSRHTCHYPD